MTAHNVPTPNKRTVFLTGASSGIGRATALMLCKAGYEVWGTARHAMRLPDDLPGFHPVTLDLNEPDSVRTAFEAAAHAAGGFDVLINNAGDVANAPLEELAVREFRLQFETLMFAPLELIRLALPEMRRRNSGMILNVTSLAVQFPIPFNAAYSAAKAALSSCSECLRLELTNTKVRVVDVQPGDVQTEILRKTRELLGPVCDAYQPALGRARAGEADKMKAACPPEKVAKLILQLLQHQKPAPRYAVGNFFEAVLATTASRFLSRRMVERLQRMVYGI